MATALGLSSLDELKNTIGFARQFRADVARSQELRRQNDPEYLASVRRGEAFKDLMREGYGPEVAEALNALPEVREYLAEVRGNAATDDMVAELAQLGITPDRNTKEGQELLTVWERACARYLNHDPRLNALYFGTSADRRQAIKEIVAAEEYRFNDVLRRQNATTLREAASRSATLPRAGRQSAQTFVPREEKVTATDPLGRRRQGRDIISRQLGDIFTHFHGA